MNYRREIDGLRALAVLPVILFHAGFEIFSGGFVGVDVFFVISGYLITSIILAELEQGKFSIVNFYERRARRILPALFLVMLVCIPFAWMWLLPSNMKDFSHSLVAASMFASNILFWSESGYFDTVAELKPLLHTWSLAVEEQYYVLFPLFLLLAWRLGKRWILILLAAVFVASLAVAQWGSLAKPAASFFLLPTRGWELLIGAFAAFYLSETNRTEFRRSICEVGGWLGLALILYSVFAYSKVTPFPGLYALVPTVGAVLIILFATQQTTVGKFVGNKVFVGIGLISYSAYLWHQPLFAFARTYTFNQVSFSLSAFLILLTFVLSIISLRYVETPFRKGSKFSGNSIFKLSTLGAILFVVFGAFGHLKDGFSYRFPSDVSLITKAVGDWGHPGQLVKGNTLGFYKLDNSKSIDVLFFGDSHAEQFAQLSSDIAKAGKNVGFLSDGGCPPIPNLLDDLHPHCFDLFERLNHILNVERSIRSIVVAGCFNCYFINGSRPTPDIGDDYNYYFLKDGQRLYFRNGMGQAEALDSFKVFLQKLSLSNKLVVIGDNPAHSSYDPSVFLAYKIRGDSSFFKSRYPDFGTDGFTLPSEQVELNQKIKSLIVQEISFISSIDIVCPNEKCNPLDSDGKPLYKDSNHMRPEFVKSAFRAHLMDALE